MILISFGHGYSARTLTDYLLPKGWHVIGTTRSEEKAEALRAQGIEAILWGQPLDAMIEEATHILISAGPGQEGDPVLQAYGDVLQAGLRPTQWLGYLSTTGVYGDHGGAWVDETTPLTPSTERGQRRVAAEQAWADLAQQTGVGLHIFRLAGIYGPGRGPFAKIRAGVARRIIKKNQVFSRIHLEDIAQVLAASMARPNPGAIYNVCDDEPAPPEDVIAEAAKLLGAPIPPDQAYESADLSPMARSFYAESKRVRNDKMKIELGINLRYPSYRDGLMALLKSGE